tara:strand:- start:273 stop:413 length:141 start_codon:yes stop_codon:yes gene_type:complete
MKYKIEIELETTNLNWFYDLMWQVSQELQANESIDWKYYIIGDEEE